uniref:membrane-associated guanylate kinase, WW and PDZ domain-containing protein 1-like n=1 Tax=Pristiophorus japonicus TaxID=55135 RepID=UPI00398F33D3
MHQVCGAARAGPQPASAADMLRKLLNVTHWTQKARESMVPRDEEGSLSLRVLGGAEYGQLLYLAQPGPEVKGRPLGGRPQAGDLLLEINQAPVSGLTHRDALGLLANARQPVHIKTVPQGSQLNCDLRHFLKQSFSKGSADFDLQERIRQNLYIRAVPCTTRSPREGEIPGTDYHFITLSEFQALDRAGGLLESGKFHGNYYGTPVPPIVPTDPSLTLDPCVLRCPQRGKSPVDLEKGSGRVEGRGRGDGELQVPSEPTGPTATVANGNMTPADTNQNAALQGKEIPALERGAEEHGPAVVSLPEHREQEGLSPEERHESKQITAPKSKETSLPGAGPQILGRFVTTTVTKTNNTFGFTIAGGNRPSELLQVVSVATGGPADRSGDLAIHDVVVAIDGASVLGYMHSEVVRLFQAVPEGASAELGLRRGYPALYTVEPRMLREASARAAPPAPAVALVPVPVMQSPGGPGFEVARGTGGLARVTRVTDPRRCPALAEGDLIAKVNGQRVRALSDRQLQEVLRTHTRAGDVILLVHRAVEGPAAVGAQLSPDSVRCSADGSAQPPAACTEHNGDSDGEGEPRGGAGSGCPDDLGAWQREEEEGSRVLAVSFDTTSADEASPASSWVPQKLSGLAEGGVRAPTSKGQPTGVRDGGGGRRPHHSAQECNGTSGKWDVREGERRPRSRSAPRDVARGSSRTKLSGFPPDQDPELYAVELERGATGFGFSVRGGREYDMDLYVLGLIVGGSAMRSGKIKIGDQLVEINGERTLGMTHTRAVELIKQGHGRIRLLMRCGNGHVPEYGPDIATEMEEVAVLDLPVRHRTQRQGPRWETQARPEPEAQSPLCAPDTRPVADVSRDNSRLGRRRGDGKGPEALPDPRPQAPPDPRAQAVPGSRPQALPDPKPQALSNSRPQAPSNSRPQALSNSRPQAHPDPKPQALSNSRPQAPSNSRPQAPSNSRPQAPSNSRPQAPSNSRPQALSNSRPQAHPDPKPQALSNSRPQAHPDFTPQPAESGDMGSEGSEPGSEGSEPGSEGSEPGSEGSEPGSEASAPVSFDEQRLLSSMIGAGLELGGSPGPVGRQGVGEGYCAHCGGRWLGGRKLRGILAPGPWVMPRKEKLRAIMAASCSC